MNKFSNMKLRYKIGVGVATTAAIVGGATAAFAYISGGSGGGSGSAAVTPSVTENDLSASAVLSSSGTLTPGGSAVSTTVTVTNSHSYSVEFGKISIALDTTAADWPATCTYANASANNWFTVGSATTGTYIATPAGPNTFTGPTVKMNDDPANDQTGCLGKSIPLVVTLSAS